MVRCAFPVNMPLKNYLRFSTAFYPVADCIGLAAYSCGGSSVAISDRSGFPLRPVAESYRLKGTDEGCIMPALPGARTDAPSGLCEDIG